MDAINRRRLVQLAATGAALAAYPSLRQAHAQQRPGLARIVVGFPPGDSADVISRKYAEKLDGKIADTLIVDNKPGAGGRLAVQEVRNSQPNGGALLLTPASMLTVYPHMFTKLAYDPFKDLVPVSRGTEYAFALTIGPMVPASVTTVSEFMAWCKANPRQAMFGASGPGTLLHFLGLMLSKASGVPLEYVPYKGGVPTLNDLMGGQIPAMFSTTSTVLQQYKARRVRILAVTSPARSRLQPEIPTMTEAGYPQVTATEWFGFFMRAGTAPELVNNASAAIQAAARLPDVVASVTPFGMEPSGSTPAELGAQLRSDFDQWGSVVKAMNIPPVE